MPSMPAAPTDASAVGIGALVVHVSVTGSYASRISNDLQAVVPLVPPTAYSTPLTVATPRRYRPVGIGALVVHVSLAGSYASTVVRPGLVPTSWPPRA